MYPNLVLCLCCIRVLEARGRLYELLAHCIPPEIIFSVSGLIPFTPLTDEHSETDILFQGLLENLLSSCDSTLKNELVGLAATHEYRMHLGQKPIFHLEAFIIAFMAMYKRFIEDTLGGSEI